jgi:D-glycerate 3-kinase
VTQGAAQDWLTAFITQERLPATFAGTARTLWAPMAERIAAAAQTAARAPFFVGICGSQASGKSTATAVLKRLLETRGLRVADLSIDDLYLTREQRRDLAARVHPLLATRGPPGTHDLALAEDLFARLAQAGTVALPRFDKAADTRRPAADWEPFAGPADIVLFEGWCVGARPQAAADLARPVNALERERDPDGRWRRFVNDALAGPYQSLFARLDRLILLQAPDFETVLGWRQEQERKLRERLSREGVGPGLAMSDAEVALFIAHYERLTRHILAEMPPRADEVVRLDPTRRPIDP